jgi:hypothetical protein
MSKNSSTSQEIERGGYVSFDSYHEHTARKRAQRERDRARRNQRAEKATRIALAFKVDLENVR